MCGLFGHKFKQADPRIAPMVAVLSVFMDDRGGDSYGYYKDGDIVKGVGKFGESENALDFGNSLYVLAHCRLKTTGKICPDNSHPFVAGNIIGAHNGMVFNHSELNTKYGRTFEVDSQHIFEHINLGLSLTDLNGYGAITYIDTREASVVHAGRFNQGQLEMAEVYADSSPEKEVIGVVWASTESALVGALQISGFKHYSLIEVSEDGHYVMGSEGVGRMKVDFDFGVRARVVVKETGYGKGYGAGYDYKDWRRDNSGPSVFYNHVKNETGYWENGLWYKDDGLTDDEDNETTEATTTESSKSDDVGLCVSCEGDSGVVWVERYSVAVCESCLNSWRGIEVQFDESETETQDEEEDARPGRALSGRETILGAVNELIPF